MGENRILLDECCDWPDGHYLLALVWTDGKKTYGVFASSIVGPHICDGSSLRSATTAEAYRFHAMNGGDNYSYMCEDGSDPHKFIAETFAQFMELIGRANDQQK